MGPFGYLKSIGPCFPIFLWCLRWSISIYNICCTFMKNKVILLNELKAIGLGRHELCSKLYPLFVISQSGPPADLTTQLRRQHSLSARRRPAALRGAPGSIQSPVAMLAAHRYWGPNGRVVGLVTIGCAFWIGVAHTDDEVDRRNSI